MSVDIYNFRELQKAIPILENIPEGTYDFYRLNKFNELFKTDIKPVYGCYYISNDTKDNTYIFGFKLHSFPFILYHGGSSYASPNII